MVMQCCHGNAVLSREHNGINYSIFRAACYHLARQLENQERYVEAVQFYGKAQAYTNATRLCRANQLDSDLISYAMYRYVMEWIYF